MNILKLLFIAALPLAAQTPASVVLMNLSVKPGIDRADVMKVMPEEVRETVKLYLDGKIQQWYSKADGKGVVFLLNCKTVEEAKAIMETLPLSKANLVNLEYTPLSPLQPLRLLAEK
jgi:hypothetical protein